MALSPDCRSPTSHGLSTGGSRGMKTRSCPCESSRPVGVAQCPGPRLPLWLQCVLKSH